MIIFFYMLHVIGNIGQVGFAIRLSIGFKIIGVDALTISSENRKSS